MRIVYLALGSIAVALAAAGVVLPLLPTTPFLLVAVWAFARSSPRLERWLITHPRLGPPLQAWRQKGAIPRRAKIVALTAMGISLAVILFNISIPLYGKGAAALVLACSAAFILSRPDA